MIKLNDDCRLSTVADYSEGEGFIHLHTIGIQRSISIGVFSSLRFTKYQNLNLSFSNGLALLPFARLAFIDKFPQILVGQIIEINSPQSKLFRIDLTTASKYALTIATCHKILGCFG